MENQETSKYRNPLEFLKVFFRRKWLFLIPACIGLVGGIMTCFLLPPTWESSTTIMVEEQKIINPLIQNLAISTSVETRMQNIRELILSWSSLIELTHKLNLDKNVRGQEDLENLIAGLRKNILVQMTRSNIIRIAYQGRNPKETYLVAQTLSDILIAKNVQSQTKEADIAINFIKDQLAIYKRKIKESEIAAIEDQLKALLVDSTEAHPMVKDLRQKIAVAQNELNSGEYEVKGPEQPIDPATRETLKKELDKLLTTDTTAEVSDSNESIYKLLLMDKVDSTLARDKTVNETIYNMLLQKLETAKITQRLETSREGTRYSIIEPARIPLNPVKPKKPVVILMSLIFGAAAGSGLVFLREFMDKSILDVEDAKHSLELPVLGTISRLTTQEEIDRERAKKKTLVTVSLLVSFSLIITAVLISLLKR